MNARFTIALLLVLSLSLVAPARNKRRRSRVNNEVRKCNLLCNGLVRYIDARLFRGDLKAKGQGSDVPLELLKSIVLKFTKARAFNGTTHEERFIKNLERFQKAFTEGKNIEQICKTVKPCKGIDRKPRRKRPTAKKLNRVNSCKVCQDVMKIVVAVIDLGNRTWHDVEDLVVDACKMYFEDDYLVAKCENVISKINSIEELLVGKLDHIRFCKGIGLCGNVSEAIKSSCGQKMKDISPWYTAYTVAQNLAGFFTEKNSMSSFARTMIRTAFLSQIRQCLSAVRSEVFSRKRRSVRSLSVPRCQICKKMSNHALDVLKRSDDSIDQLAEHLQALCTSVKSPVGAKRCAIISSLANSTDSMMASIMSHELCQRVPCSVLNSDNGPNPSKACEMCKTISRIVMKDIKYLTSTIDFVIEEVQMLCSEYAQPETAKVCLKVTKILQNIDKYMESEFEDYKVCDELKIC